MTGTKAAFEVTSVVADIVYGKMTQQTGPVTVTRKTSLTYLQDQYGRKNSGSPGYIKGLPVKTGTLVVPINNPTQAYLNEPV